MVSPAARSVSSVAYSIAQLRLSLLFMVCAFLFFFSRAWRAGGWFCLVCAPRVGLLGGGVAACAPACCEGEAGAVCAGSVVAAQDCEGELRLVSVYYDEDCVYFPAVRVVVVLAVFDVGVHDAGASVAAIVGVFEVVPSVRSRRNPHWLPG